LRSFSSCLIEQQDAFSRIMNGSNLHAPNLSLECLAMMKFQQVSTIYVNSSASGCKCRHASTYLLGPSCARLRTASNSSRSILDRPLIWSQYEKALLSRSFLVGPQMTGFLELRSARCFENAAFHICLLSWTWSFLLSLGYMCRRQTFVQTPALHNVLWFRKRTESMSVGQSQQRAKALLLTVSRCQPANNQSHRNLPWTSSSGTENLACPVQT